MLLFFFSDNLLFCSKISKLYRRISKGDRINATTSVLHKEGESKFDSNLRLTSCVINLFTKCTHVTKWNSKLVLIKIREVYTAFTLIATNFSICNTYLCYDHVVTGRVRIICFGNKSETGHVEYIPHNWKDKHADYGPCWHVLIEFVLKSEFRVYIRARRRLKIQHGHLST